MKFLPYGRQTIEDDDIAAVAEALRGDFLTTGPLVGEFEQAFAAKVGASHAVCCNSGTAALHLATLALGLSEGDVAIVPAVTFLATANAVRYVGAEVEFADVDPRSGLMTPQTLEAALARAASRGKVRAILPVHLKGVPCDMPAIAAIAEKQGLDVVEDAAHALGTVYGGLQVGANAHARMTAFSIHPVKTMTCGEGGIVTTEDAKLAAALRRFRSHGMQADPSQGPWYYEMVEPGFNYRLPDINCALGLSQLKKLERFITRRAELVAVYDWLLPRLVPFVLPPARPADAHPAWHLYAVQIDFERAGVTRAHLMTALREDGIGTQVHYIPVPRQPYYRDRYGEGSFPGADAYYASTLSLPLFPAMKDSDVERVVSALAKRLGLK
ncbi:MAG TPA: UDP-4-amino-4,6-dideoxy-N-acetyl-beta-L-altrosamine transaminase [Magnetospirillaceae bacterium]|nr:UDP-4-amino-4,6-dideoxy-N-acetyl-beta-L-altrosamine transaminase [Magnetospirillaceae bacterium]